MDFGYFFLVAPPTLKVHFKGLLFGCHSSKDNLLSVRERERVRSLCCWRVGEEIVGWQVASTHQGRHHFTPSTLGHLTLTHLTLLTLSYKA